MIKVILVNNNIREKEEISAVISSHRDLTIQALGNDNYDAVALVKKYKPDIVLLEAALIFNDGMEINKTLKRYSPATSIVVYSSQVRDSLIKAMVNGVLTDCLIKDHDMARLAIILRKIYRGEHYINPRITARANQMLADFFTGKITPPSINEEIPLFVPADFSKSELDVLRLVTMGYNSKEISGYLYLKEGTVRNYISSIIQKTGVKNKTQVVLYAQKWGLSKSGKRPVTEAKQSCKTA